MRDRASRARAAVGSRMWPVILIWLIWCSVIGVTLSRGNLCRAASDAPSAAGSRLIALAAQRFPHLTAAERAMLWFSDIDNGDRGEFAAAGTVVVPGDPSNDPAKADKWGASREIRAALIRWMCVDHQAQSLVDPAGIRVLGARIVGVLNLALVSVPIPIVLDNCVLIEPINLGGTEIPYLELDGSYTREIHASGLHVQQQSQHGQGLSCGRRHLSGSREDWPRPRFRGRTLALCEEPRGTVSGSTSSDALCLSDPGRRQRLAEPGL